MKKSLFIILICLCSYTAKSQTDTTAKQEVFYTVDVLPEYPGGIEKMYRFINKNLKYPKQAKENSIMGTVQVKFIVEKDGTLTNIEISQGLNTEIDAEAIRLVSLFPKWHPGLAAGMPARVQYTIPIKFPHN
ncbi:energy transducer TonB [Mucilaginibacter terrae]|uniref:energy transducer TonB n=1 Tax=Mucilaginibacter terrae TaxID=1955052 RepID=UPI00363CA2AF